jgi:hypothetical protein
MTQKQIFILLIILLLFIGLFILITKYKSSKQNVSNKFIKKDSIEPTSTDYVKRKNVVNQPIKKNNKHVNIDSHLLKTNGWEYNEWILPDEFNTNVINIKNKSTSYWDSCGIPITKEEKYHHTIPKELPNLGDTAVVKNQDDWLFDPNMGLLNNSPV